MPEHLILGIDIGTTSVKVCVVDPTTKKIIAKQSKDTAANVPSDLGVEGNKQDVPKIISALHACVVRLPRDLLRQICRIGICGQMHGVLMWKIGDTASSWEKVERDDGTLVRYDISREHVSHLYTWQDSRCEPEFLASLPTPNSHLPTYSGYGCATLFWMAKNRPDKVERYNCAGTIQDFTVAMLCNLNKPIMSVQNASSWGYFDCMSKTFNKDILEEAGFPVDILPEVIENGAVAGSLSDCWHGVPAGTPVGAALGDLQCSVLATLENPSDAVLNISTSAQLAFVADNFDPNSIPNNPGHVEYFPYFDNQYLAVGASLNGGNCLATFVKMLQQWTMDLGFSVPQSKIWEKVMTLGIDETAVSNLHIVPTLLGERYCPNQNASIQNVDLSNLGLGKIFRALCRGMIENLHSIIPKEMLDDAKIERIVGNGSGLSRNKVLQTEVQDQYHLPLVFTAGGDAALGAALAIKEYSMGNE